MPEEAPKRRGGRPRKNAVEILPSDLTPKKIAAARENAEKAGEFPPQFVGGVPNPDYYRAMCDAVNVEQLKAIRAGETAAWYKPTMDGIHAAAEYAGVDKRSLLETRTPMQVLEDVLDIIKKDGDAILELPEAVIQRVEEAMDESDKSVDDYLSKRDESDRLAWAAMGKRLGSLFRRLRTLRRRATMEIPSPPKEDDFEYTRKITVQRAATPLRFMCYVIRSNISDLQQQGGASAVPIIEPYHGKMAVTVFCAWNRCEIVQFEVIGGYQYDGAMIIIPPRHGKTQFATSFWCREICKNPNFKLLIIHAVEEQAHKNAEYLKTLFKTDNPAGRRVAALYGEFHLTKKGNGTGEMRLATKETSRQQTIASYGMKGRVAGSDADGLWFDDPVDKQERDQEQERERTYSTLSGPWMQRLTGENARHLTTATFWHHDDANCKRFRLICAKKLMTKALVLGCGGPDTVPKFWALSPRLVPSHKLRNFHEADSRMYNAAYRSDPSPEEMRIIRKIRYYDPDSEEHAGLLRTGLFHLSLDPSATAREGSDKAGLVYAVAGTITGNITKHGEFFEHKTELRMRIIWAAGILATQSDLVEKVSEFASGRRVDYVHVEVVSGYAGTAEMFRNLLDIQPICHQPGNRSKEIRLRGVAPMIEDSYRNGGGSGACVEFPGKVTIVDGEPKLGPDPAYEWLYRQFLEFGSVNDDHCLDATTQLVAHLQRNGELEPGQGFVTNQIHNVAAGFARMTRMQRFYATLREQEKPRPVELEDAMFLARMN